MVLLIKALRDGRPHQVKLLLRAGVNVNLTDENGQTALMHCCFLEEKKTRITMLKLLVAEGVDPNKRDKFGRGFVSWACVFGREDLLCFMLKDSFVELDLNTVDNDGNSPLYLAVLSGDLETVKLVLKELQRTCSLDEIHKTNNAGICPLLAAFHRGDKCCARLLITEGDAPVSSVLKYLKELAEYGTDHISHPFYAFSSAKSHDLKVNLLDCNPNVPTKKDLLNFLFANDDTLTSNHSHKKTIRGTKNTSEGLQNLSPRKKTSGLNSRYSLDSLDTDESKSMAGSDPCSQSHVSIATDMTTEDCKLLQLYDVYKEQLTDSYREGLPVRRYRTPTPPPAPRKDSKARPNRTSQQHGNEVKGLLSPKRGSVSSSSGSLPLVNESALDKQIRLKYARSNRAASMQVGKLPPIPGNLRKLKKTKSSASFKLH